MISSLTPVTTAVPLIGVLLLIAIKDAYDDIVSSKSYFFKTWRTPATFSWSGRLYLVMKIEHFKKVNNEGVFDDAKFHQEDIEYAVINHHTKQSLGATSRIIKDDLFSTTYRSKICHESRAII